MERIPQNRPREGYFYKFLGAMTRPPLLYVPDMTNGPFSVIHDSERCVL